MDTRNSESVKDFEKGSSMRKAPSTEWPLNITTHACKQFTDTHSCAQQSHVHGLWPETRLCTWWTVCRKALLHLKITWTWTLARGAFVRSTRRREYSLLTCTNMCKRHAIVPQVKTELYLKLKRTTIQGERAQCARQTTME
jgi:hypothetical protein